MEISKYLVWVFIVGIAIILGYIFIRLIPFILIILVILYLFRIISKVFKSKKNKDSGIDVEEIKDFQTIKREVIDVEYKEIQKDKLD